ncbi:MAG: transglutaminase-like domain-containing protein, partial [Kistimonas sp.]|nr:transglutaminase-like domain-containing protein [Kistimonas sp.]
LWRRIQALCWQPGAGWGPEQTAGTQSAPRRRPDEGCDALSAADAPSSGSVPRQSLLDGRTDEDIQPPVELVFPCTFGSQHDDALSRLAILHPVCVDGCLRADWAQPGRMGFEVILPDAIDANEALRLDLRQHYGAHPLRYSRDWQSLPGVHAADRLVQMRTDPPCRTRILRDCDTGLHYVRFLDAPPHARESVVVHFVLEEPDASKAGRAGSGPPGLHPDACCDPILRQRLDAFLAADNRDLVSRQTQWALQKILIARSQEERVRAIYQYCCGFKAEKTPEAGEDLLEFLLRERQGSCRHRAWIYVLLCRRWGIAARIVEGVCHRFGEYSLDGGYSWKVHNPGGGGQIEIRQEPLAALQPHWCGSPSMHDGVRALSADDQTILLANLKTTDWQPLAAHLSRYDCAIEPVAILKGEVCLEYACRLSEVALLGSLLASRVMEAFVLGCRLIQERDRPSEATLGLVASRTISLSFLGDSVARLCLDGSNAQMQVRQQLADLKSWLCRQGQHHLWRRMVHTCCGRILLLIHQNNDLAALGEAMLCWLLERGELRLQAQEFCSNDVWMHSELLNMAQQEGCRSLAQQQLRHWYQAWVRLPALADPFTGDREPMVGDIAFRAWKPSCYGGRLPSLESELFSHGEGEAWTDQPEGVPDVERLLMQRPAFRTRRAVLSRGRQLVILGQYSPGMQCLQTFVTRVLDRIAPDVELNGLQKRRCAELVLWAFCCCVYGTVGRGRGTLNLLTIWRETQSEKGIGGSACHSSGLMSVTSLEQLVRALLMSPEGMQAGWHADVNQEASIQEACNVPDALVLSVDRKWELLEEFLDTMDMEAFIQDRGQQLWELVCAYAE